ncbi:MAG: hypothetical protein KBD44_01860 [Candidatus Pacebacteria bacterium]|nr:hypothetical protein [Candidatus Paceibacterota bacterium]
MTLVLKKDGTLYETVEHSQQIYLADEERKLASMEGLLISDATEAAERDAYYAEIDASGLSKEVKNAAKAARMFSPSGVKQKDVDDQRARVDEIKKLLKVK